MAKRKHSNQPGFKRQKSNQISKKTMNKRARNNLHQHELVPDDSGDSSEEVVNVASEDEQEEVKVYKEPTMYDTLLKTLGSASESIADAYKRQCAEEAKVDADEDEENDLESLSASDEDADVSENESESDALDQNDVQGASLAAMEEHSEDDGDDDDEADEDDDDDDVAADQDIEKENSVAKESESSSSFSTHLEHELSKEEVENISTKKEKYKWKLNAANCEWTATRELNLEDSYSKSPYGLYMKLYDHWLNTYKKSKGHDLHSSRQRSFFSLCNSYRDILHHKKKPFYRKGKEEDSNIMDAYLLHSLNHIFKTRALVTKNDKTLAKQKESKGEEVLAGEKFLDQGFTRPKVLIILPIASIAFRVINRMIQLTPEGHKVSVDHVSRFSDEFGRRPDKPESWKKLKPLDYQTLFGGNSNDNFMIGIKFTKKTIKLYSDFYTSDVIVASPLALIRKMEDTKAEKEKDVDYLSSIEVLIIDHVDVLAMQNWSLLIAVVKQLNRIPSKQHGTDIMRIRPWYLDEQARFYRQSIILGSFVNAEINNLFNEYCHNYEGKVRLLTKHKGVLSKVLVDVKQIYERIDIESTEIDDHEARLDYFKNKVFPKIKDSVQGGIMIFIRSYFEYVLLRGFLKSQDASVCLLSESTDKKDISRSRVSFFEGQKKIMLYTERAHFYYRYKIRGIQNLIMYSLPERKELYREIVNMLEGSNSMNCTVLFTRYDRLRLERIVGTASAKQLLRSDKQIFAFC